MMRHRRKHEGRGGVAVADVGDAQSDSDTDSLPTNSALLFCLRISNVV